MIKTKLTEHRAEITKLLKQDAPRSFTVFLAQAADQEKLQNFSHQIFGDDDLHPDSLHYGLNHGHFLYFGLEKNGALVAGCAIEANCGQRRLYIVEFGVLRAYRKQQLGLWLLQQVEQLARTFDYRTIASHTLPHNRASLALHKQCGMLPARLIKGYFHDGQDCYYMRKTVR